MANMIPLIKSGGFFASRYWTPLVIGNGLTTTGGDTPDPPVQKTVSGSIVTINDALAAPAVALSTAINPVQSGSGDPSPTNVRPISGFSEANVTRAGGNLFDEATASRYNRYLAISSGQWLSYSGSRSYAYDCEPNTTYVISASNENLTIFRAAYIKVDSWTGTTALNMYGYQALTEPGILTVTTDADAKKIVIQINQSIADDRNAGVEIRKADVYSISFGTAGTVYGGALDVKTGTLTVDKTYIPIKGAGSWQLAQSGYFYATISGKAPGTANVISDIYTTKVRASWETGDDFVIAGNANTGQVYIRDSRFTTQADFRANADGNMCFEIDTPQTYTLTPTEVQLLLGTNNVWSDTGDTTLTYLADGRVDSLTALNMLLGNMYTPSADVSDREALQIIMGESE